MNQVAFSPSAERVAFASEKASAIEVVDVATGKRARQSLPAEPRDLNVAWSPEEARFYITHDGGNRFAVNIAPDFTITLESLNGTNEAALLACYGRVGSSRWWGGGDWGNSFHSDQCNQIRARAFPGLGSSLRIYQDGGEKKRIFLMTVNPGLLHLSAFQCGDVAFLDGCNECLFEASGGLYLIDLKRKRLGSLVMGERFILFTPRYQKQL